MLDATLRLSDALLHRSAVDPTRLSRVGPAYERQRRIADAAREILNQAPATTLAALAAQLAISPRHLSRVFHEHTGMTLARYRNELRCRIVLEAVAGDAPSLARVAAELGFADQAHLTRTVSRLTGRPPSAYRRHTSR